MSDSGYLETVTESLAVELWRADPDAALAGHTKYLPENSIPAIVSLAAEDRSRFLKLISYLPDLVQDIFIQFYILRRTQSQIAETLGILQSPDVWQALALGTEAICAILAWGPDPSKMNGHAAAASYRSVLKTKVKPSTRRTLSLRFPVYLGSFILPLNSVDLQEVFVFKWRQGAIKN